MFIFLKSTPKTDILIPNMAHFEKKKKLGPNLARRIQSSASSWIIRGLLLA
jgi:hypothetical protein